MPLRRRQRKFILIAGLVVAGLVTLLFSLPLWLPWLLRPLVHRQGVYYSSYERVGYSHFALHGVSFTNKSVSLHAGRVEALIPTVWAWRCLRPRASQGQPYIYVNDWSFSSTPTDEPSGSSVAQFEKLEVALSAIKRWLPLTVLSNGTAQVQVAKLRVPYVGWSEGELSAEFLLPIADQLPTVLLQHAGTNFLNPASCNLRLQTGYVPPGRSNSQDVISYRLEIQSEPLHLKSEFIFAANKAGLDVQNTNLVWGNRLEGRAHFGRQSVLPELAELQARDFQFPSELAGLPEYGPITGSASAIWENGQFKVDVSAGASPRSGQTNLPPIEVSLQVQGDTNSATITTAQISAGWLKAELSRGLSIYYSGQLIRKPGTLKVSADLNRQPWLSLQGILSGEADFAPLRETLPTVHFLLSGTEIGTPGLVAKTLHLSGSLDWPALEITNADVVMADGSTGEIKGKLEMGKLTVSAGRFDLQGPYARRWLPAGTSYGSLRLAGTFEGRLHEMGHRGRLEMTDFTTPHLQPLSVKGEWSGKEASLDSAEVNITSGSVSLLARGALTARADKVDLLVTNLSVLTNGLTVLELAHPSRISLGRVDSSGELRIDSSPIDWSGTAGQVHAEATSNWPRQGEFHLSARQLPLSLFTGLFAGEFPPIEIKELDATVGWTNGPAIFDIDLVAAGQLPIGAGPGRLFEGGRAETNTIVPVSDLTTPDSQQLTNREFSINLKLSGDHHGLAISNLLITTQTSRVAVIRGTLPITLSPAFQTNWVHLDERAPIECVASIQPEDLFWKEIAKWTGIGFRQPRLNLSVSGTWHDPEGQLDLKAQKLQLQVHGVALPSLEDLRVSVVIDSKQVRITEGQLLIQGQRASLVAQVPLGAAFWSRLNSPTPPEWQKASAHFQMQGVELAAFEPLYPKLLTPQGTMNVDLSLLPGANLEGTIVLEHARTRPLAQLGPIRNIAVKLRFQDRLAKLESATALVSGFPVELTGQANLQGFDWLHGAIPPFKVSLRGTNVLLQRQAESIIRGNLDLTVASTNGETPLISGTAHLSDSYYLSDLSALVPGKIASPERRPPYFSLSDPALTDWRLAVTVDGVRFMKVRGTLFNGEVSTNLKLQGTLTDPVALGDVRVDSGYVHFPFATFQVQQGLVTLTSKDPYRPQLLVNAKSRQYGYDIRMDITGPVDAPMVQFNSTPPLSSEQILLMVTAGQMPQATFSLSTQQRAQTMALFFGRDLLVKLGLGDQSQERLTLSSGQEVSDQGRSTYDVEYKLTDRWSLVGAYDRFGDFNAGFKWLIYSK